MSAIMSVSALSGASMASHRRVNNQCKSKRTIALRSSKASRTALQVSSSGEYGGYTKEEWEAKLAATPSIGAWQPKGFGGVATVKAAAKAQADANRMLYEEKAKAVFAAVKAAEASAGTNPAAAAPDMSASSVSDALELQLKKSLKNKVNPAVELSPDMPFEVAAAAMAKQLKMSLTNKVNMAVDTAAMGQDMQAMALSRQLKSSEQQAWEEKLAKIPSLGAWNNGSKGEIDSKVQAQAASAIYQRKANLVFAEVSRKAAVKAEADANSALYQEKAKAVFAALAGGAKGDNGMSAMLAEIEERTAERSAWISKWRAAGEDSGNDMSAMLADIDNRVTERNAWIAKWRTASTSADRIASWKEAEPKDKKPQVVLMDVDRSIDETECPMAPQATYNDGSVMYVFGDL